MCLPFPPLRPNPEQQQQALLAWLLFLQQQSQRLREGRALMQLRASQQQPPTQSPPLGKLYGLRPQHGLWDGFETSHGETAPESPPTPSETP